MANVSVSEELQEGAVATKSLFSVRLPHTSPSAHSGLGCLTPVRSCRPRVWPSAWHMVGTSCFLSEGIKGENVR